ncbi:hypothetical protein HYV80_02815 [Candidatus Woesearchaeota archaeon]|nr:hypothetical protein [Candidatus Woesearchaeota archaeon]
MDDRTFEKFIGRALKNQSYIEAISLLHNTIEIYLQYRVIRHLTDGKPIKYYIKKRQKIKSGGKQNSLAILAEVCHLFDIIDDSIFTKIKTFNRGRNDVIHNLLQTKLLYSEIQSIARLGREIQLKLSPFDWDEQHINQIMSYFDNPERIPEEDLP